MSKPQTKKLPVRNFAIFIAVFFVIGMMLGPNINQVYTGTSVTGADTVELTNSGNLDTKVRDFSLVSGSWSAISDSGGTVSPFSEKKMITFSHDGVLTGYQNELTILYESAMLGNFNDIRFVTQSGDHIPYWIASQTDGSTANIWIKNDHLDGDTYIWMYYGNEDLSRGSDGNTVFDFWGGSVSDFTGTVSGTWVDDGDLIKQTQTAAEGSTYAYKDMPSRDYIVEMQMRPDSWADTDYVHGIIIRNNGLSLWTQVTGHSFSSTYDNKAEVGYFNHISGWGDRVSPGFTFTLGTWYNYKVFAPLASSNTKIKGKAWIVGTSEPESYQVDADLTSYADKLNIGILGGTGGSNVRSPSSYRYFRARQYTAIEPTYTIGAVQCPEIIDPGIEVGGDRLYYDGILSSTLTYSDDNAYIDSSDVSVSMKGSLPIIKVGTSQNIKIDHDLQYSITYTSKNMDITSPDMLRAGEDMRVDTRLTDTAGNPISYQPLEMRTRLFDSNDKQYLDEIVGSTSFIIPGKYLHDNKHYQLRLSYEGYEFGGWSNEILADFDIGTEGFTITSSPDKAPEGIAAVSFAAVEGLVGMAVTGWLNAPIIGDIIRFIANLVGVEL